MEFDHDNVKQAVEEDRLSSLPEDLIHKILSCFDMKFAVQTCLLSSKWKLLWTSLPCLNLASWQFGSLPKFAKFVNHVLTHRNHQIEVSSLKLDFGGAASQVFVRKIANYAFSHNVQEITIVCFPKNHHEYPPSLFISHSLKHLTLSNIPPYGSPHITPITPWDFPSLTTLHLSDITLCDENSEISIDLFSKCVNLKNLTLKSFILKAVDIITPRLSTLTLIDGRSSLVINLIAPQLENLTIIDCSIDNLNAPPGLLSLCYKGYLPKQLSKDRFHSLDKASISLSLHCSHMPYKEKHAQKTINMLQELHSARYLTLNVDIVECLSSFPDLVSQHPSPFSNLISLSVHSRRRSDAYNVKMSTEARNFFLENSPNATFTMELPEAPPTKAMKQKEAREKKAKRAAEIETHMKELQALIDQKNLVVERQLAKEKANAAVEKFIAEMKGQAGKGVSSEAGRLKAEFNICVEEMRVLVKEEKAEFMAFISKEAIIKMVLDNMRKRERTEVEARYSRQLEEAKAHSGRLLTEIRNSEAIFSYEKLISDTFLKYQDVSGSKLPLTSAIPTPSTSSLNPML